MEAMASPRDPRVGGRWVLRRGGKYSESVAGSPEIDSLLTGSGVLSWVWEALEDVREGHELARLFDEPLDSWNP